MTIMKRLLPALFLCLPLTLNAFEIELSSNGFVTSPVFSNVETFRFSIDIDGELQTGLYVNPTLNNVTYSVSGTLVAGTPSQFPAFDLMREIDGQAFYDQGSSLRFEISETADLRDGLQLDELVGDGNDIVFSFNGREIDNGRFHPALFELRADGTGSIQNSNNIPTQNPLLEVDFGEEYITNLVFNTGGLTLISAAQAECGRNSCKNDGGGAIHLSLLALFSFLLLFRRWKP